MLPLPIRPRRPIYGASAVLLPFASESVVDWDGFDRLLADTRDASLVPAVNMDTGYANLIDEATREEVLQRTEGQTFIAGVFVPSQRGDRFSADAYVRAAEPIVSRGGQPILFQSYGLTALRDAELADAYAAIGERIGEFLAFELGNAFADFGRIYSLAEYERLLNIPSCVGAKHSSLSRSAEWRRLELRDCKRPGFRVLTGNDLAIDMVMYGSDYLLGLSAFHPHAFRLRDRLWEVGDERFYELNDWLQYLGFFAFRDPVPAYKHSAAMTLHNRGRIASDRTHPHSPTRPASDAAILETLLAELQQCVDAAKAALDG